MSTPCPAKKLARRNLSLHLRVIGTILSIGGNLVFWAIAPWSPPLIKLLGPACIVSLGLGLFLWGHCMVLDDEAHPYKRRIQDV